MCSKIFENTAFGHVTEVPAMMLRFLNELFHVQNPLIFLKPWYIQNPVENVR